MKKVIPEKTEYYCDICGKKMVDYVSYRDTTRLKIKPIKRKRRLVFSFMRKEMIDIILTMIAIILSPLLIVCAFVSSVLIMCILIAIASVIVEGIRKLIENVKK